VRAGHELGYYPEVVDQSKIWNEDAAQCLRRDGAIMNALFGVPICGVARHGGMTGYNNLDFWKDNATTITFMNSGRTAFPILIGRFTKVASRRSQDIAGTLREECHEVSFN
jgi:hypothetical protein